MSDQLDLVDRAIIHAVRSGDNSYWKLDSRYPAKGRTWQERYNEGKGDKQALLWAIEECGETGKVIPDWAHVALRRCLLDGSRGEFKTWDGAFDKIFYDRNGLDNTKRLVKRIGPLGDRILELWNDGYSLGDGTQSVWNELSGDRKRNKDDWKLYKKLKGLPERMKRK